MLDTSRLHLRNWQESDKPLFAKMSSDPDVMRYFPSLLDKAQSDAMADKCQQLINQNGYGFWAVEHKQDRRFIGLIGLHQPQDDLPFSPCVEIGWRLDRAYWGQGLAVEGAMACLDFAFDILGLGQVVSFTAKLNLPSQRVMQKLGMQFIYEFDHPAVKHSPLTRHVLYVLDSQTKCHGTINKQNFSP